MGRVGSYRELVVYREAFALAMELFHVLRTFPDDEIYDLVRQLRRSSRSVCANIAEAWRRRRYPSAFIAKLIDAEAEAAETRVHLEFAHACEYLSAQQVADFDRRYDRLLARLSAMRAHPERWTPRPRRPNPSPHSRAVARKVAAGPGMPAAATNPGQEASNESAAPPSRPLRREPPSSPESTEKGTLR